MDTKEIYYKDYLALEKVLKAQHPESETAHDEMLFIIIHQTYELWFKQILFEIDSVIDLFQQPFIQDNSPDLYTVNHRLSRVVTILKVLVHQIDIMETMTPLDFLDFRDLLRPASGFQSIQFKVLEAKLGLKMEHRHGKEYYTSQLKEKDLHFIKEMEEEASLLQLLNDWLARMPFFKPERNELWTDYRPIVQQHADHLHIFWNDYLHLYQQSLISGEQLNLDIFKDLLHPDIEIENAGLSSKASRNALFIMLYRDYPLLQLPYQLLNTLLEIDEQLATWRFRHVNMVQRIIGKRIGTGGSSGEKYLRAAMNKHYIFKDLAILTSFLIERRNLPKLPKKLQERLGFRIGE